MTPIATALLAILVLATLAVKTGALDRTGAATGAVLGTVVHLALGWPGFLLLLMFVVLGTGATRLGHTRRSDVRIPLEHESPRGAANALANAAVPAACALLAALTPDPDLFRHAFTAAMAAATADTLESEIGIAWGGSPRLITTLRQVPPGTDGGISTLGTLAGFAGALTITALAAATDLIPSSHLLPLSLIALAATLFESLIGALLERPGYLNNHTTNLLNTLIAALAAIALL